MFEDHQQFDFLEFHLSQVIAVDGSKLNKANVGKHVYIPKQLQSEMEKRGLSEPNHALQEMYFQKQKVADDTESEREEKPRVYKVLKAYHDVVKAQGKGD